MHAWDYWDLLKSDYDTVTFNDMANLKAQPGLLRMTDSCLKYASEAQDKQRSHLWKFIDFE